jgi:hypothetical protein
MNTNKLFHRLAALVVASIAIPAMAQYPANNQVGQVDNRVGGELYGNNSNALTLRPYQVRLLPSEERNAIVRSGMLPSELELNTSTVGPLSPNGVLDYITRSPLQRDMHLSPQLYNPAYELTLDPFVRSRTENLPAKPGFDDSAQPQKRQESAARPLRALQPSNTEALPTGELPTGQLPSGRLSNRPEVLPPVHTIVHTVRHGTLPPRHPTTQPSLSPETKQ